MVCVAWKAGLTECRLSKKGEVRKAVKIALQTGYTHIDCALIYGNESEVGEGIKDWGGDRSKIWVTSKLWNHQHHPSEVSKGLETTLKDLQLEYIDLYDPHHVMIFTDERYLIHWPLAFQPGKGQFPKDDDGNVIIDKQTTVADVFPHPANCKY